MPIHCGVVHPLVPFDPKGKWVAIVEGPFVGMVGQVTSTSDKGQILNVLVRGIDGSGTFVVARSNCKLLSLVDIPDKVREVCEKEKRSMRRRR